MVADRGRLRVLGTRIAGRIWRAVRHPGRSVARLVAASRFRTVVRWSARVTLVLLAVTTIGGWLYFNSVSLPNDPIAPQASEIFYRDGHTLLARVGITSRTDVPLDQIPLAVRNAVLAAEDRDFYHHFGISVRGVLRAAWSDVSGGSEGASTITQQYVRNAYLTQDRTVGRKAKELVLAVKLEQRFSKDEILDRYLNAIYFGRGAYGIAAAARAYFGVGVDQLTVAQGAVLAAVIKDPWYFDPAVGPAAALARWQWIVTSMNQLGWLSTDALATTRYPVVLPEAPTDTTPAGVNGLIVGLVERELNDEGISPQVLHTAGLRVVSTIDAADQQRALDAVRGGLHGLDPGIHAALVAVDPASGGILAYYGGNRGDGFFDDASAPRRPASTFKPITLAAGLHSGVSYRSIWDGSSPRTFRDRGGVPLDNADKQQCPRCPLDQAMVESLNTPFYALAQRLGGNTIRDLALQLGIPPTYDNRTSLMDGAGDPRPGFTRADITLGVYPVSPADLATVYATFADGGVRVDRHVVAEVRDHTGRDLWYTAVPVHTTVLDPAVVADVTTVLSEVVDADKVRPGRPAAGKTGTQQWGNSADNEDAWMAGYTPQLATVVWVGRPSPGPIRDQAGHPMEGKGVPADIWRTFLTAAMLGQPAQPFPPPAHLGRNLGDAEPAPAGVTAPTPSPTSGPPVKKTAGPGPTSPPPGPPTSPSTSPSPNGSMQGHPIGSASP